MKLSNLALLCAALLGTSVSGAVRWEVLNPRGPRQALQRNSSLEAVTQDVPAVSSTTAGIVVSAQVTGSGLQGAPISTPETTMLSTSETIVTDSSAMDSIPLFSKSSAESAGSSNFESASTHIMPQTTDEMYLTVTTPISSSSPTPSEFQDMTTQSPLFPANSSITSSSSSPGICTPLANDKAVTEFSVVYTSTITFFGNSSDYTPPFAPVMTPDFCSPSDPAMITVHRTSFISNNTIPTFSPGPSSTQADNPDEPLFTAAPEATPMIITLRPLLSLTRHIITFITTDKNPSVVFSSEPTPSFSQMGVSGDVGDDDHRTIEDVDPPITSQASPTPLDSVKLPPQPTFSVTAGGDQVIINSKTITGLLPGQTSTVTVGSQTFTILPTAVVGLGSTISKPAPRETDAPALAPASKIVGGVTVTISDSHAIIGGTTLALPSKSTTTILNGRTIVLGPNNLAVDGETLSFVTPTPQPTNEIVSGGELLTAIGKSVVILGSATITYGINIPAKDTVINGDTVSIGPRGISLHGMTIGGPNANVADTSYEIVGGITVGRLPHSLIVINGGTHTISPSGDVVDLKTTVIGDQTITIGPDGLVVSSTTLSYPGASVTATLMPSGTYASYFPVETGNGNHDGTGDEDNAAFFRRPDMFFAAMCLSMTAMFCL